MQYPRNSFAVVSFYQLMFRQLTSFGTALLLDLVLLIITGNSRTFSSSRHDHMYYTCVIKIRGTEITLQQTHTLPSLTKLKIPKMAIFPLLEHRDLLPLSDLSTAEIPWILASRKAHKIVSIQTDFNPSNTCSKLIYQKPVPILKGLVSKNTAHRLITHTCE